MGVKRDEWYMAREHNEKRQKDILDDSRQNQPKFKESDFPQGEQIAPAVYRCGDMIVIGDKY